MKKITILLLSLLSTVSLLAQENVGVNFNEGKTFEELLQMAREQNKPVFIDCYTEWCGPCKMMAKQEFPKKEAGDYFNSKFVCGTFDMEKGEGVELRKRYDVNVFPTFLMIRNDGELINRSAGACDITKFIGIIEKAMTTENPLLSMEKRFKEGERDEKFIKEYIKLLDDNYMRKEKKNVIVTILSNHTTEQVAADTALFRTFIYSGFTPADDYFLSIYKHRDIVEANQGKKMASDFDGLWLNYAMRFLVYDNHDFKELDEKGLSELMAKAQEYNVPIAKDIESTLRRNAAYYGKDYPTLYQFTVDYANNPHSYNYNDNNILQCVTVLADNYVADRKVRKQLEKIAILRIEAVKKNSIGKGRTVKIKGVEMPMDEYYISKYEEVLAKVKK